jgi:hypothetical protein
MYIRGRPAAAFRPRIDFMSQAGDSQPTECIVVVESGDDLLGGLAGELDPERRDQLSGSLIRRTRDWARDLSGSEATLCSGSQAASAVESMPQATVVLLRPALVRLGPDHAADLRDDLAHGCDLVVGPTLSGGWYMLALGPKAHQLAKQAGSGEAGSAARLLAAARGIERGLSVGLLRAERDLVTSADLLAARVDPLIDRDLAALLA